jgi:hypothetical protein
LNANGPGRFSWKRETPPYNIPLSVAVKPL